MDRHSTRLLRALPFVLASAVPIIHTTDVFATSNGITGYSGMTSGKTCTSCHGTGAAVPTVTVTGSSTVTAGATASYTVTITGGPAVDGSLDVAASGGTLAVVSAGTKLSSGEIVHSAPAAFTSSGVTYTFNWVAPATAGTYTLYVAGMSSNGSGSSGDGVTTKTFPISVTAAMMPPVASFLVTPSPATVATTVNFDGSASKATTGGTATISAYDWNFGDNSAGAGAKVTHSYATAGTYSVVLKITDSTGATASATKSLVVNAATPTPAPMPTAKFSVSPSPAVVSTAVTFDASASTTPNTSISAYEWNFGDNTALGTGKTATHTYGAAGTYSVSLKVTDNTGATNSATGSLVVKAATTPPAASDGQALYDANCASCHGPNGTGVRNGSGGPIVNATATQITRAIARVPVMKSLSTLTSADIQAIADVLKAAGTTPPVVTSGQELYGQYCASCHGADATGISGVAGGNIVGESVGDIIESISEVSAMRSLKGVLNVTQIRSIANFLQVLGDESEDDDEGEDGDSIAPGDKNTYGDRLAPQTFGDAPAADSSSGGGSLDAMMLGFVALLGAMRRRRRM